MNDENKGQHDRFVEDFDSMLWQTAASMGLVGQDDQKLCDPPYALFVGELLGFSDCICNPVEAMTEEAMLLRFMGYQTVCKSTVLKHLPGDLLMQALYLAKYRYLDDPESGEELKPVLVTT